MVKDRIGNVLSKGNRLVVALPEAQIIGFVAEIQEQSVIRGSRGGAEASPGMVLVSCVIALPIDTASGKVAQCVKVYDPDKHDNDGPHVVQPN
jgi:hypothetical protein